MENLAAVPPPFPVLRNEGIITAPLDSTWPDYRGAGLKAPASHRHTNMCLYGRQQLQEILPYVQQCNTSADKQSKTTGQRHQCVQSVLGTPKPESPPAQASPPETRAGNPASATWFLSRALIHFGSLWMTKMLPSPRGRCKAANSLHRWEKSLFCLGACSRFFFSAAGWQRQRQVWCPVPTLPLPSTPS